MMGARCLLEWIGIARQEQAGFSCLAQCGFVAGEDFSFSEVANRPSPLCRCLLSTNQCAQCCVWRNLGIAEHSSTLDRRG